MLRLPSCFARCSDPAAVRAAQQRRPQNWKLLREELTTKLVGGLQVAGAPATPPPGCSKEKMDQLYSEAVMQWCNAVRSALPSFNGYECKEIHGKFTLCFTDIRMAIGFATSIQVGATGPCL